MIYERIEQTLALCVLAATVGGFCYTQSTDKPSAPEPAKCQPMLETPAPIERTPREPLVKYQGGELELDNSANW